MTIVDRLRALIKSRGGNPTGTMTIEQGVHKLEKIEEANNPLSALVVDVDVAAAEDLLGKVIGDLQENVVVGSHYVTGTLFFVDDYTGFSGDPALQEGHYLVTHASVPDVNGVTISVSLSMREGSKNLDADGILVTRLTEEHMGQNVKLTWTAKKEGYPDYSVTLNLTKLILGPAKDED